VDAADKIAFESEPASLPHALIAFFESCSQKMKPKSVLCRMNQWGISGAASFNNWRNMLCSPHKNGNDPLCVFQGWVYKTAFGYLRECGRVRLKIP